MTGASHRIPFIKLPIADLPPDFFPLTCRVCFDYTNSLADVTVGYMGGPGDQWLMVRNDRGEELVALLEDELVSAPISQSAGAARARCARFLATCSVRQGGLPLRRAPPLGPRPLIGVGDADVRSQGARVRAEPGSR